MGLEKDVDSKFDGRRTKGFVKIDAITLNFASNRVLVRVRTFATEQAYAQGREPIDVNEVEFADLVSLLAAAPTDVVDKAHDWLLTLQAFTGAVKKADPVIGNGPT